MVRGINRHLKMVDPQNKLQKYLYMSLCLHFMFMLSLHTCIHVYIDLHVCVYLN